ncbi:hypothetical protein WISP_00334 [Willisornis vidua]|uniref:Uncharacterized protein n=1 Tax=Willisornis vidua TaxID=1566151 RepID=A0ABQ9E004_9PASS|nr:hypothetical protein WISP_00334 [Willisornis vidua]
MAESALGTAESALGPEDRDFLLALRLQREWEEEDKAAAEAAAEEAAAAAAKRADVPPHCPSPRPLSVVDEAWELLDPSPDVHALFVHFNQTLFWRKLEAVTVSWSPRMTRCRDRTWRRAGLARRGLAGRPVPAGRCVPGDARPEPRVRAAGRAVTRVAARLRVSGERVMES